MSGSRQFHSVSIHRTEAGRIEEADWSSGCGAIHVLHRPGAVSLERHDIFVTQSCGTVAHFDITAHYSKMDERAILQGGLGGTMLARADTS